MKTIRVSELRRALEDERKSLNGLGNLLMDLAAAAEPTPTPLDWS